MRLTKEDCTDTCLAVFFECTHEDLLEPLIQYYKNTDEYTYLSLKKDQLRNKLKTFKRIMEHGGNFPGGKSASVDCTGNSTILGTLQRMYHESANKPVQLEVDWYDDDEIIILDEDFDNDAVYKYNPSLDMYMHMSSKVFVKPDNSAAYEIIFSSYIKFE